METLKILQSVAANIFVCSSVEMGMFRKTDGCPPNGGYQGYSFALWQGIVNCLPNGSYWLTVYTQSVMSSMVGPVEQA